MELKGNGGRMARMTLRERYTGGTVQAVVEPDLRAFLALYAADDLTRWRIEPLVQRAGYGLTTSTDSIEELLDGVSASDPALVILACELALFKRASVLDLLRSQLSDTPLIVVATGDARAASRKALRLGVQGFVREADVEQTLTATVDAVLAGQLCVPDMMRGELARPAFSHREKQVLELLVLGLTNAEIADELFLSESTVKSHVASSFRKLDVSTRAEAAERVLSPDSGLHLGMIAVAAEQRQEVAHVS